MSALAADPQVGSLVEQLAQRHCGLGVDIDELRSAGMLAAVQATERYDPTRGSLTAFLWRRVNGAIRDAARRDCSAILTPRGCRPLRPVGDSQRDELTALSDLVSDHRGDQSPDVSMMVDDLPDDEAEVVRCLSGLDDMSPMAVDDLADLLGLTATEVTAIRDRAYETLRRRLDDLDYHVLNIEEPTMSRLNGFHAPEPADVATAEPDGKRCPSCARSFKNPKYKRCYFRDCSASGYGAAHATASVKGRKSKATKRKPAPVDRPLMAVAAPITAPVPTRSLADEIQAMTLLAGLAPGARQRVLSWATAAFGA